MNTDIFASMLFGDDAGAIEKYLQSDEVKAQITVNSSVAALMHILIEKNITTEEHYKKIMKMYEEEIIKQTKEKIKKELKSIKEG